MNAVVVSRRRGGRSFVRLVGDLLMGRFGALGRHDPVAAPLRPADDTGQSVKRQQAEQEPHHWGAGSAGLIRWRRGVGVGSGAVWLVHRCSTWRWGAVCRMRVMVEQVVIPRKRSWGQASSATSLQTPTLRRCTATPRLPTRARPIPRPGRVLRLVRLLRLLMER